MVDYQILDHVCCQKWGLLWTTNYIGPVDQKMKKHAWGRSLNVIEMEVGVEEVGVELIDWKFLQTYVTPVPVPVQVHED